MDAKRTRELLIEEATTAWRPRHPDGTILIHPAWADLDPAAREKVFTETVASRRLERGLDPNNYSTTVHAVMARIMVEGRAEARVEEMANHLAEKLKQSLAGAG